MNNTYELHVLKKKKKKKKRFIITLLSSGDHSFLLIPQKPRTDCIFCPCSVSPPNGDQISVSLALVPRTQSSLFSLMKPLLRYPWVIKCRSGYNYRLDTGML